MAFVSVAMRCCGLLVSKSSIIQFCSLWTGCCYSPWRGTGTCLLCSRFDTVAYASRLMSCCDVAPGWRTWTWVVDPDPFHTDNCCWTRCVNIRGRRFPAALDFTSYQPLTRLTRTVIVLWYHCILVYLWCTHSSPPNSMEKHLFFFFFKNDPLRCCVFTRYVLKKISEFKSVLTNKHHKTQHWSKQYVGIHVRHCFGPYETLV